MLQILQITRRQMKRLGAIFLISILLIGCATATTEQEYFVLNNSSASKISMISGVPQTSIRRIKLPSYLNQRGIARQLSNGKISVSTQQLWAEKLSQAIPTLLAQEIAVKKNQPIEIHPLPPGIQVKNIIEVDITQFLGDDKRLALQAGYRLVKPKKLQTYHFATTVALKDTRVMTLVDAYQRALMALAADIAKHL